MIKAKVKVSFPKAQAVIKKIGLHRGGRVQEFVDTEIVRGCDDYVPKDVGNLRDSVYTNAKGKFGDGKLTWDIYGNENGRNTWNDTTSHFQDAPMRGPFWALRFWNSGGKETVIKAANEFIRRLFNA